MPQTQVPEWVNLLELTPQRVASWKEVEGRVVLERPRPPRRLAALGAWISYWLSARQIRLDELGSRAWRSLDGSRSVRQVAQELRREFGEAAEPAEERLGSFVRMLRREGMLVYPEWDEVPGR